MCLFHTCSEACLPFSVFTQGSIIHWCHTAAVWMMLYNLLPRQHLRMLPILLFYSDVALGNRLYNSYTPP